ncbi:hypothetical protein [Natronococcus sp. A-GB7]|uniref:DUF7344 domain-containing protein n=1 Tax=Natronococcus sp. A-GB7 TaxID=3037649 RepID=UPI00241C370A|nr:hypothetical protein [Natronococcus sp. A-GB7]MDG5821714.1 hypothetical protein [Natronococcus sp. A-GB7]
MGEPTTQQNWITQYDSASWLIAAIGSVLGVSGLAYVITHPEPMAVWLTELALVSLPAAAIVSGGYWVAKHRLPREEKWNIAKWCLAGAVVAGLLVVGYIGAEQIGGETVLNPELLVILGALGGSLVALFASVSTERRYLETTVTADNHLQLDSLDTEPFSAEAQAFAELALDTRSWNVIHALRLSEGPLGIEKIASQIAAIEETDEQDVYLDLVHVRLPKLTDRNLITYHSDIDIVELSDRIGAVADASDELSAAGEKVALKESN